MTRFTLPAAATFATAMTFALPAAAQDACAVPGDRWDLDEAGVAALYDCMEGRMLEAYTKEGDATAAAYRDWTVTATRAAVAGPHQERFLLTFVNDVAAEQYLKFEAGDFAMPVGSVLVKESIGVRDGVARVGPLFIMEKVDTAEAAEYGDWFYSGIQPNGKPLRISQQFCHDCHGGYEAQDSMGYPLEEVRIAAN